MPPAGLKKLFSPFSNTGRAHTDRSQPAVAARADNALPPSSPLQRQKERSSVRTALMKRLAQFGKNKVNPSDTPPPVPLDRQSVAEDALCNRL